MKTMLAVLLLVVLSAPARVVFAIDHKNLDENRPLRLEDAYLTVHNNTAAMRLPITPAVPPTANPTVYPWCVITGPSPNDPSASPRYNAVL